MKKFKLLSLYLVTPWSCGRCALNKSKSVEDSSAIWLTQIEWAGFVERSIEPA